MCFSTVSNMSTTIFAKVYKLPGNIVTCPECRIQPKPNTRICT